MAPVDFESLSSLGGWLAGVRSASHVGDEENDAEHDAEGTNYDVADGEEIVGAAKDVSSREHEVLAAIERAYIVSVVNRQRVITFGQILYDLAVQLAEVRQTCSSHPHDEVRILHVHPLELICICFRLKVLELVFHIGFPGNLSRVDRVGR